MGIWAVQRIRESVRTDKIQIYLCKPVTPQVQVTVCPQVGNLEPVPVPVSTCGTNTMGLPAPVLHPNGRHLLEPANPHGVHMDCHMSLIVLLHSYNIFAH
jgi:hypothetical protein